MSLSLSSTDTAGLLYVGFNQDAGCFAIGMQDGFRVFNTDPLKQKERMDFKGEDGTGVAFVEMLFRTNFLGILGGGRRPRIKSNMAMIWDDLKKKFVIEFEYPSDIRALRLRRDRMVVVLHSVIKVYTFEPLPKQLHHWDTGPNPLGLACLCQSSTRALLAFPGQKSGTVMVTDLLQQVGGDQPAGGGGGGVRVIAAHENELIALAINQKGTLLATASEKGTLIRIFDTETLAQVNELRRGTNNATIYNIAFNMDSTMVCVSSDHGTIHIFKLEEEGKSGGKSQKGSFLPKYFSARVSDVRCSLPNNTKVICAFSTTSPNTVVVLGADGTYFKYTISGSEAIRECYSNFLTFDDDSD